MKNLSKPGSLCMYPIEYRWIKVETPVTNSAMVTERGSTSKAAFTCKPATGNQVNMLRMANLWLEGSPRMWIHTMTAATNEPPAAAVPTHPASGFSKAAAKQRG